MRVTEEQVMEAARRLVPRLEAVALAAGMKPRKPSGGSRYVGSAPLPPPPPPQPWRYEAACIQHPTLDFVQAPGDREVAVCGTCNVKDECYEYGISTPGLVGLYGGVDMRRELQRKWGRT